jgi:hypothetical protein
MPTSGFVSLKISATSAEIGWTVEDPEIVIEPVRPLGPVGSEPSPSLEQAAETIASAPNRATRAAHRFPFTIEPSFGPVR